MSQFPRACPNARRAAAAATTTGTRVRHAGVLAMAVFAAVTAALGQSLSTELGSLATIRTGVKSKRISSYNRTGGKAASMRRQLRGHDGARRR